MSQFLYTVILPSKKQPVNLTELFFFDYKQLVKNIINDNNIVIQEQFNSVVQRLCLSEYNELTFLDKLVILLTIRSVCISPVLELMYQHPQTKQRYNLSFNISEIIEKVTEAKFSTSLNSDVHNYGNIEIVYGLPTDLYYNSDDKSILSSIKRIAVNGIDVTEGKERIIDRLPAIVYSDAKKHLSSIKTKLNDITLLSIRMSNDITNNITITPDIFNDSMLDFLKLCYRRDLTSFYEMEYFLTSKINIPYEIIKNSTYAELLVYVSIYNDERKRQQQTEKQNKNPMSVS